MTRHRALKKTDQGNAWGALGVMAVMAVVAIATVFSLLTFAARRNPNLALSRTAVVSTRAVESPAGPAAAERAVFQFWPYGDSETVGTAMANATGHTPRTLVGLAKVAVKASSASFAVTITVPVDLRALERSGEVTLGPLSTNSRPSAGDLAVNAYDGHEYQLRFAPETKSAVFQFRLSRSGRKLWGLNANGLAAIGQNVAFNSV